MGGRVKGVEVVVALGYLILYAVPACCSLSSKLRFGNGSSYNGRPEVEVYRADFFWKIPQSDDSYPVAAKNLLLQNLNIDNRT